MTIISLLFLFLFLTTPIYANCPLCIVTVGGGLLLAKKLGIDDLIVSIWLSGLNTAIGFLIATTIKRKIWNNPYLWSAGFYLITIIYLLFTKQIGHPRNVFLGIDKVLLGMTIGFLVFLLTVYTDKIIRKKNKGKVIIKYQKVIMPFIFLTLATIVFKILL